MELINKSLDHTLFPDNNEHTSANLESLGTIMLQMMNETKVSLESTVAGWSAEAVHFLEATSFASPAELSAVSLFKPEFLPLLRLSSMYS